MRAEYRLWVQFLMEVIIAWIVSQVCRQKISVFCILNFCLSSAPPLVVSQFNLFFMQFNNRKPCRYIWSCCFADRSFADCVATLI